MHDQADAGDQGQQQHGQLVDVEADVDRQVADIQQAIEPDGNRPARRDLGQRGDGEPERAGDGGNADPVRLRAQATASQGEREGRQEGEKGD